MTRGHSEAMTPKHGWSASHLQSQHPWGSPNHPWSLPVICGVYQPSVESTSHLQSLPTICGFYQPSVGSISYFWSLPIICEPYQLFVGSTRHLWVLSVIYRAYQSSVGSTSHLCGLPAICMVYQSSVWSICHLWDLSAICGVYQPSVVLIIGQIFTHLQNHKNYSSEHLVCAINSFLIIISQAVHGIMATTGPQTVWAIQRRLKLCRLVLGVSVKTLNLQTWGSVYLGGCLTSQGSEE